MTHLQFHTTLLRLNVICILYFNLQKYNTEKINYYVNLFKYVQYNYIYTYTHHYITQHLFIFSWQFNIAKG